jgi:hypothetical protein
MSELTLTTRRADLATLHGILTDQRIRRLDVIAPSAAITAENGMLRVSGSQQVISEAGVTPADGVYTPTSVCDTGIADKLQIPQAFLRRLRAGRLDLWDSNVNGLLHGDPFDLETRPADPRAFMLRILKGDDEGTGVVRAFLSDKYARIDNLDVLVAALDGVRQAGVTVQVGDCDLTENKMYVKVHAPEVAALAPNLLKDYRNPFGVGGPAQVGHGAGWTVPEALAAAAREGQGYQPGTEPVVFAGFMISNSETGGGAFTLTPRLVVRICRNGLTITADALRSIHLGGKQEEGVVDWSQDTLDKQLALVTAKARDAVATFLTPKYVAAKVAELEELAGTPVTDPAATITKVIQQSSVIPSGLESSVLDYFIKGGQITAGGIMQAVTAAAQTVDDADLAADLEAAAPAVLVSAARLA